MTDYKRGLICFGMSLLSLIFNVNDLIYWFALGSSLWFYNLSESKNG